ncbi:hypothetical protein GCM10027343_14130 [Noviherbaspirillum agri]
MYNHPLIFAAPAWSNREREPTSPGIIPFFSGCTVTNQMTAFDKTAVPLDLIALAEPKADDDPAVPGQDRFLYWHWR